MKEIILVAKTDWSKKPASEGASSLG